MAVRLRFLGEPLACAVPSSGLVATEFTATNESGSTLCLAAALPLQLALVDGDSGAPLPSCLILRDASASVAVDGRGSLRGRICAAAGAPAWRKPFRLCLTSAAPARVRRGPGLRHLLYAPPIVVSSYR
jgi:hypothetical protein